MEKSKTAIIIGAGPAGLTAAYELLQKTDVKPIVLPVQKHRLFGFDYRLVGVTDRTHKPDRRGIWYPIFSQSESAVTGS